jgi:hypothetical protein
MTRVGQNHIFTVYIRYFWQENHQIYGHIQCIYTVMANPKHDIGMLWLLCCGLLLGLARTVYVYTPYTTVNLVTSLPKIPYTYTHRARQ